MEGGGRGDGRVERAEDTGEWEERGKGRGRNVTL